LSKHALASLLAIVLAATSSRSEVRFRIEVPLDYFKATISNSMPRNTNISKSDQTSTSLKYGFIPGYYQWSNGRRKTGIGLLATTSVSFAMAYAYGRSASSWSRRYEQLPSYMISERAKSYKEVNNRSKTSDYFALVSNVAYAYNWIDAFHHWNKHRINKDRKHPSPVNPQHPNSAKLDTPTLPKVNQQFAEISPKRKPINLKSVRIRVAEKVEYRGFVYSGRHWLKGIGILVKNDSLILASNVGGESVSISLSNITEMQIRSSFFEDWQAVNFSYTDSEKMLRVLGYKARTDERKPIKVDADVIDSIAYMGVETLVGTRLGSSFGGLLSRERGLLILDSSVKKVWEGKFQEIGNSLLKMYGYPVKKLSTTMFSEYQSLGGVRYALAGKVTAAKLDTYDELAGNRSEGRLSVYWEVMDLKTKNLVYTEEINSEGESEGVNAQAISNSFTTIFEELLADSSFVESVSEENEQIGRISDVWTGRALPPANQIIELKPENENYLADESLYKANATAVVTLAHKSGSGSAFIISKECLAITNFHVVDNAQNLTAHSYDGASHPVRVVRSNEEADIALVQIGNSGICSTVRIGPTSGPEVGDDLLVIGTPLSSNFDRSLTKGIVSGLRLGPGVTFIQTDAAINPGNSGGPAIDGHSGETIGVASAKLVRKDVEGIGFAIDIHDALRSVGIRIR
jgi:S1-C subfamily serine protease